MHVQLVVKLIFSEQIEQSRLNLHGIFISPLQQMS